MSGWGKLGEALAGTSDARRADIQAKTINALANRDANVARAQLGMAKARDSARLGEYFKDIGMDNPEAYAGISRSGANLNTLTRGQGNMQEQDFRRAAVEAATGGDYGAANAQLMGVANGPVEIPKVTGGMLLSNRLVPGGGAVEVTPVGAAQIAADQARGEAALIRANRTPVGRSGGGGGTGSAKLTDRQKGQLADIKAQKKIAMGVIEATAGAQNPTAQASRKEAEAALLKLNQQEASIYDQQEGLGSRLAPGAAGQDRVVNGVPVPDDWDTEAFTHAVAINKDRKAAGLPPLTGAQMAEFKKTGELRERVAAPAREAAGAPPVPGARKSPKDGLWYIPDPSRPGKYLRVDG